MNENAKALVLEVLRQDDLLKMSVFEKDELVQTVRHYSSLTLPAEELSRLSREALTTLNKIKKEEASRSFALEALRKTGQLLWDHLLTRAVKFRLKTAQSRDLIISIDEELVGIPWEILCDGEDFLCLKFNLGRLVKTKGELNPPQYRSLSSKVRMLILANPTGDLRSAYLEGLNIKNKFDSRRVQLSIDFKSSTVDTMYVKKNLRDYDVVHFAGHCEYDLRHPEASGWVLSDGKFTGRDIMAQGDNMTLPTLIFSNACHSAEIGADLIDFDTQQKAYTLASAFLFSGVRHYIGAIRRIEDPVSFIFAKEFYNSLLKGNSMGECVRSGRLKLIQDCGIESLAWSSYVLYGDPNFILFRTRPKTDQGRGWVKQIFKHKKFISRLALAALIIFFGVSMYLLLPTLKPNTYFLFLKARGSFLKGNNQEVILDTGKIIAKDPLFLAAYPLLADTYQRLGQWEQALKCYFDYALHSQKRQDHKSLADAYLGIGWTYLLHGEYPKAFDFYNKAMSVSTENNDVLHQAQAMRRLAEWHLDKGENDLALELLTKSSEINLRRQHIGKHGYNLACDYFDLGLVFANKDDYVQARVFYKKSFELFVKLRLEHELSDCYFNIGEMYLFEKQYQKALDSYMRGLKIDQSKGSLFGMASDYNMIGELYLEMGNLALAEENFNQAVKIAKDINARMELAWAYRNLGILYKAKGRKNKAREFLRNAQEIYQYIDTPDFQQIKKEFLELDKIS